MTFNRIRSSAESRHLRKRREELVEILSSGDADDELPEELDLSSLTAATSALEGTWREINRTADRVVWEQRRQGQTEDVYRTALPDRPDVVELLLIGADDDLNASKQHLRDLLAKQGKQLATTTELAQAANKPVPTAPAFLTEAEGLLQSADDGIGFDPLEAQTQAIDPT